MKLKESVQKVYENIIRSYLNANPLTAHMLGFHEYDGQLPKFDPNSIQLRIIECKNQLEELKALVEPKDKQLRYNHDLIQNALETEIFNLEIRKEYKENPAIYIFPLAIIETNYTNRNFAPVLERVKSIISLQREVPKFLEMALQNLNMEIPKAKILMSIQFGKGILNYWQDKLIEFVTRIDDEVIIDKWSEINLTAIEALNAFIEKLSVTYLPTSHSNFALGKEKFLTLLKYEEGVSLSAERLLEIGEQDMSRNLSALLELGKEVGGLEEFLEKLTLDQPSSDSLLMDVKAGLERIQKFLVVSDFVDLPTTKQCEVIHTPEFARAFASGAMNTPGPFESEDANEAYYWVTPPDPILDGEKLVEYMKFFSYPMLEILTIHEVWPGHYLQLLFNNKSTDKVAKIFARSTSMIEGWAHYTEEEIIRAGYNAEGEIGIHEIRAAQLLKALMRNARYISAIKMHCFGMTVEESERLFHEKAFMSPIKSKLEANRGTMDPMYLNYTLGKLMIFKLREDYKKELTKKGEKFSLKKFHNKLLSYGSPPITVLRKLMLYSPGNTSDVL